MGASGGPTMGKGLAGLPGLAAPEVSPSPPREESRSLIALGVGSSDRAHCIACCREADSAGICQRCARRMKSLLLSVDSARISGRWFCCLKCHKLLSGKHDHHQSMIIPLGWYNGKEVAWSSGDEIWAAIFASISIQSAKCDRPIRPYLLRKPGPDRVVRSSACSDIMTSDCLYGSFTSYCTLKCLVARDRGSHATVEVMLTEAIVAIDKEQNTFCLTCRTGFQRPGDQVHRGHDWLSIRTYSDGHKRRVLIPAGHQMEKAWEHVKKWSGNEVLISDDLTNRCLGCQTRLADTSHTACCFECLLDEKTRLVPRCLRLKLKKCSN